MCCLVMCWVQIRYLKKALNLQGDGNAFIFQDDPAVFTFSMHGEGNFPARKQISDMDIPLPDGTNDDTYLRCVLARLKLSAIVFSTNRCPAIFQEHQLSTK